jgi:hypothetical protein
MSLQLNTSFNQRLTVLAPRISEQEYKEILASWAGMRNRADYQAVVQRVDSDAAAKGVVLPDFLGGADPSK